MEKHINLLSHGLVAKGILNEVLVSNTIARTERYYDNSVRITKVPEYGRLQSAPLTPNFSHFLKILGKEADILHFHFPNPTAELALILSNINKPLVCTELGTGTSFVNQHQKTGLVVRPNDAAALAQALNYLLENSEIREKYGKAGRKRVEKHFSEETMIASTIATYESVYNPSVGAFRMEPVKNSVLIARGRILSAFRKILKLLHGGSVRGK